MNKKRTLKESFSKVEVAISKALNRAVMHPSEVEEIAHLTTHELCTDHGLDYLLAEKVRTHVSLEHNRLKNQSMLTWEIDSRDLEGSYTRTYPMKEGKKINENLPDELPSLLPDDHRDDGRMLDYGDQKSDSHEGRMMRQALFQMAEYAEDLHDMLEDNDDLPQWCHYKIATARNSLSKVKHYLEYKLAREET